MARRIVFECEGPLTPDGERDPRRPACTARETVGWDDPAPAGWVYTMMGADLCPSCQLR
jgi:hypothetical protein